MMDGKKASAGCQNLLLDLLDEAFDRKSWHGPNLRGSVKGVTAAEAAWRPAPGRHNIWELTLHAAYWKYVARRRLTGIRRGTFALAGSNFFARPEPGGATENAWKKDLSILANEHRELRRAVEQVLDQASLPESTLHLIRGIAAHDLYHAGQIRMLRRLQQ